MIKTSLLLWTTILEPEFVKMLGRLRVIGLLTAKNWKIGNMSG